jgi:glutamate carboxypeptidase
MNYAEILSYANSQKHSMIEDLEILVNYESPSRNKIQLDRLSSFLVGRFTAMGAACDTLNSQKGGNHVRITLTPTRPGPNRKPALVLGHFDTVWPVSTLAQRPFTVEENIAFGPGAFDMKGGIVIIEYALQIIKDLDLPLQRPVIVLLNSDEEIGSPHSRKFIEEEAQKSEYVLVMEPALSGGELKTARKGVGAFTISVEGRAAHAGAEPESGVNAIVELAHQILHIETFAYPEIGTTLNVGTISGGTRSNVVPAHAQARIDGRVWTRQEALRIATLFQQLEPFNPEVQLKVRGGFGRPPMERLPETGSLFASVAAVGKELGMTLTEGKTGGASDGNFCTALGIPTLDGLGVTGLGAHAEHEQVNINSLPERTALLIGILCTV